MNLFRRIADRIRGLPLPRVRRILLGLYLFVALADAAGKAIAASPSFQRAVAPRVQGASAAQLHKAVVRSGNFELFRLASRNLLDERDMYALYPGLDRFKYSPTFALLFSPLAVIPWPVALFLWGAINALVLFTAIEMLLPAGAAMLTLALLLLEVLRTTQNAQSNALVCGLIILAFIAVQRGQSWRAAAAVAAGTFIKIFPLAALSFALPRWRWRVIAACAVLGVAGIFLPLLVTPPSGLLMQYRSWLAVETMDAGQHSIAGGQLFLSFMELVRHWSGRDWPNWPAQAIGTLVLLAPLAVRRARWSEPRFRLLYLCSLLHYVVLFNHQSERPTMIIAFAGSTIWFASEPRARWRTALYAVAWLTIPAMSTLIPGAWLRTPTAFLYRMVLPTLAIWIAIQVELWRRQASDASRSMWTLPLSAADTGQPSLVA